MALTPLVNRLFASVCFPETLPKGTQKLKESRGLLQLTRNPGTHCVISITVVTNFQGTGVAETSHRSCVCLTS